MFTEILSKTETVTTVKFTCEATGKFVERQVNNVITDGKYDAEATEVRIQEVARGVQHKIDLGVAGIVPEQAAE